MENIIKCFDLHKKCMRTHFYNNNLCLAVAYGIKRCKNIKLNRCKIALKFFGARWFVRSQKRKNRKNFRKLKLNCRSLERCDTIKSFEIPNNDEIYEQPFSASQNNSSDHETLKNKINMNEFYMISVMLDEQPGEFFMTETITLCLF